MIVRVVDTETTGLGGWTHGDHVVDVGVAEADTAAGTVVPLYSQIVGHDVSRWSPEQRGAWIFSHSDLTLDDVAGARPAPAVAKELSGILSGRIVTSYNLGFDLDKFLLHPPWRVEPALLAPDIMIEAHRVVEGDLWSPNGSTSWPRLEKAYRELCPDDPAGMDGPQAHRALSDAVQAAHVLLRLVDRGIYPRELPEAAA